MLAMNARPDTRPRHQFLPSWAIVLAIVIVMLGGFAIYAVSASEAEDRRTCRVIEEAYGEPGSPSDC